MPEWSKGVDSRPTANARGFESRSWQFWLYSVMVSTLDFESNNPGSTPGTTFFFNKTGNILHN
jgi:hypothetical protein